MNFPYKNKFLAFLNIISLLGMICLIQVNNQATADIISLIEGTTGSILPRNDTNLQMIEADVVLKFDIDSRYNTIFNLAFNGIYKLYNPNDTIELVIGAPFYYEYFDGIVENRSIQVNGITTDFDIIFFWDDNTSLNLWLDYFSLDDWRYFAMCNITADGYSNTTIQYKFDSSFYAHSKTDLFLSYDVGTSRAWNGNLTENVEFKVHGKQPSSYSNKTLAQTTKFTLAEIENGISYLWTWEDVIIEDNSVWLRYAFHEHTTEVSGLSFLNTVIALVLSICLYATNNKKKKHRY